MWFEDDERIEFLQQAIDAVKKHWRRDDDLYSLMLVWIVDQGL